MQEQKPAFPQKKNGGLRILSKGENLLSIALGSISSEEEKGEKRED